MSPETADTIRHAADVVQWFDLAAWSAILLLALDMGRRWKSARPYLVGPVSLGVHNVVFYLVALLVGMSGPVASFWSALRVLHVALLILAIMVAAFFIALSPAPPEWAGYEGTRHE
jgi:hypothetical protein